MRRAAKTLMALFFVASLSLSEASAGGDRVLAARSGCRGTIAECLAEDLDSEFNRRILEAEHYISYGALLRDSIPCSMGGASYYNCRPGAEANPYRRGCSAITRCRS